MRDHQRQRLYDFERVHLYTPTDAVFESLDCIQAFTDELWLRLDLDQGLRPSVKWLRSGARQAGKFRYRTGDVDETQLLFNRNEVLSMSLVLHELAHAVQYAKLGDDGPTSHDEMFCRVYFELQDHLNNECLEDLILDAREYGLEVWPYTTLTWDTVTP